MSNQSDTPNTVATSTPPSSRVLPTKPLLAALAGVAMCGVVAAAVTSRGDGASIVTPLQPTTVAALHPSSAVAAKGTVEEIYGDKFVIADATGRALVETGPDSGTDGAVKRAETVQVQGRFEKGSLHATVLIHADGRRVTLGPNHSMGVLDRGKQRLGLLPTPDVAALTALVQSAGYTDVRVAGRGPRHLEVVARGADGRDRDLHVDFDGRIRPVDLF